MVNSTTTKTIVERGTMTTNQLYKIPEVAQKLSLSKSKVYGLINDGKIETLKIDKSIRVSEEALSKFIRSIGVEDGNDNSNI